MTPESAMVLTGKQALDYSGGVSAEDNFGIGGYERDHGPERPGPVLGARPRRRLRAAAALLRAHLRGAGRALPAPRRDRATRSTATCAAPHEAPDSDLRTVGEIFAEETNPGRKKPFDIRSVMRAVADPDHPPLERWAACARRRSRWCGTPTSAAGRWR